LAESNAIDLVFVARMTVPPINCDHQTNRFERAICAADCSAYSGNRLIVEPASRDEIERSVVVREPTPSILAIERSIIVATQAGLRPGSAYQSVRAPKARRLRLLKRKEVAPWRASGTEKSFGELTRLHRVPAEKAIRQLYAVQRPVAQSEGRPRAHSTHRRPCVE
jgi:hypothetical protein